MWLVFAIGACVCWSLGTIFSKSGLKRTEFEIVSAIKTLVFLLFAWYLVFSKNVAQQIATISYNSLVHIFILGILISGAMISYHAALKSGGVIKATACERISSILNLSLGIVIFKEESNMLLRIMGIILIFAGVVIILNNKSKSQKAKWLVPGIISAVLTSSAIIIAKKYNETDTKPAYFSKKLPESNAIIGNFALHGINGVKIVVIFLSSSFSIILVPIIPGTEHPEPTINGIILFPFNPIFLKTLSNIIEILAI